MLDRNFTLHSQYRTTESVSVISASHSVSTYRGRSKTATGHEQQGHPMLCIFLLITFRPNLGRGREIKMTKIYLLQRSERGDILDPPLPLRPYIAVFNRQDISYSLIFVTLRLRKLRLCNSGGTVTPQIEQVS